MSSIPHCRTTWKYHTVGPTKFTMVDQRWTAGPNPKEVSSQEVFEFNEDGKRAPSRPWIRPRVEESKPRLLPHRLKWRRSHDAVHWFDLKLAHQANDCKRHHTARIHAPQTALKESERHRSRNAAPKRDSARNLSQVKHTEKMSGWYQKLIKDLMKYHKLKCKRIKHEWG